MIIHIKFVADITDKSTVKALKTIWENSTLRERESILEKMGHSLKYATENFENLTSEIQSKIVTK